MFEDTVNMYVYEELVNGRKLTEIINEDHENVKYLPGHKLPANIVRSLMSRVSKIPFAIRYDGCLVAVK